MRLFFFTWVNVKLLSGMGFILTSSGPPWYYAETGFRALGG
jgi:hypothetical protein